MRLFRILFIVAAAASCFVTTSCKKEQAAPNVEKVVAPANDSKPAPVLPKPVVDTRPVIVTFGDSLTAGVAGRSYPEQLQDLLDENHLSYRVDNQGVSGDTTTDGLARIDNVIAVHPKLVLLEFGGNDGLRGVPVTATESNLDKMIRGLREANIPVVLLGITLPPNYGPDYVKPFTAMFPKLAKQHSLKLFPFLLVHVYQNPSLMQPDGIHPNGDGNKIVARDVFDFIKPNLARASSPPKRLN